MKKIEGKRNEATLRAEELSSHVGEEVKIHGSIYKIRKMKGFSFVLLRTPREILQCVAPETVELAAEESCVIVTALVAAEERSRLGYELHIREMEILSVPLEPMPIVVNQKQVDTSLENLLKYRMLTMRNEKQRAVFKIQEGICQGFRSFLEKEGFTEIHTPKIVQTGAEGGANIFKLDYFGQEAYLAQSPQFYKQMMVGVFERVFEVAPVFRAEKHDTARHLNEYTSVDLEMGYIQSFEDVMQTETAMLRHTMSWLQERCRKELELLDVKLPATDAIPAVRFREAKEMVASHYRRPVTDWGDFEPEEERLLCELMFRQTGSEFVFVTHYPGDKRPFYAMSRRSADDGESGEETESFDLLFRGMEITTGGQRIHGYEEQVEKMRRRDMNIDLFESYLLMHRHGMPPHGGFGLGLERFTGRLLGYDNVRLAAMFPRDINRLTP